MLEISVACLLFLSYDVKIGMLIPTKTPMIATTIRRSANVKPLLLNVI